MKLFARCVGEAACFPNDKGTSITASTQSVQTQKRFNGHIMHSGALPYMLFCSRLCLELLSFEPRCPKCFLSLPPHPSPATAHGKVSRVAQSPPV